MVKEDIEGLVEWAYRVQCVDRMAGLMSVASGRTAPRMRSNTDMMVAFAALGVRVDSSPGYVTAMGATAQDDALVIHDAVLQLPAEAVALVVGHGKGGSRPPWHGVEAEALVADTDRKGRVRMLRDNCRPVACLLRHRIDPALVMFSRAQYGVWWEALAALADELHGKLETIDPLPPSAPREPWFLPPLVYVEEGMQIGA
ncbi:hypothetical protein V5F40_06755 [Xanthobacter sp. DSM 14520]|uniref:hypothetical protein n=1 Tax=Xanthobacter autotrophicus (strain ATCC BAA-1158 / Py2) TaxID=78245 RepID=UPI00372A30B1